MNETHGRSTGFGEGYPSHQVIGVIDNVEATQAAIDAVTRMSIADELIDIVCDTVREEQLAEYQAEHPWRARVNHILTSISNESELLEQYNEMLSRGRLIVRVKVDNEKQAEAVADAMQKQGGHFINYFGPQVITTLVA